MSPHTLFDFFGGFKAPLSLDDERPHTLVIWPGREALDSTRRGDGALSHILRNVTVDGMPDRDIYTSEAFLAQLKEVCLKETSWPNLGPRAESQIHFQVKSRRDKGRWKGWDITVVKVVA